MAEIKVCCFNEETKDYCESCKEYINQVEIKNGVFGCPLCKSDNHIITFYNSDGEEKEYCECKKEHYKDCKICTRARKYKNEICPECERPILYEERGERI